MVAPPDNDVLWARGLTYAHDGSPALQGVSLGVREGEILAVTGPRGSGKTTLLRCLSGQLRVQRGEVWFNSVPVHTMGPLARERLRLDRFAWIDPEPVLVPELNAWENTALPLMLRGTGRRAAKAAALEWLERLDIRDAARKRPHALLQSERQRVVVARALVSGPTVLFADEPTAALHRAEHGHVLRTLTTAARSHDITVVLATHDPGTASLADRTLTLLDGRRVNTVHLPPTPKTEGSRRRPERRTPRPDADAGRGHAPAAERDHRSAVTAQGPSAAPTEGRSGAEQTARPTDGRNRPAEGRGRSTAAEGGEAMAQEAGVAGTPQAGTATARQGSEAATRQPGEAVAQQADETAARRGSEAATRQAGEATTGQAGEAVARQADDTAARQGSEAVTRQAGEAVGQQPGGPSAEGDPPGAPDAEERAAADGEGRAACSLSA